MRDEQSLARAHLGSERAGRGDTQSLWNSAQTDLAAGHLQ